MRAITLKLHPFHRSFIAMQLITSSSDRTVTQTADQQAQPQTQHPLPRRQLIAKWETVNGKLECHWILI
jgi:hypothetical protein